jgi:hypothetical protein
MRYSELSARLVGLLVAVAGAVVTWRGLLATAADGAPGIELLARGTVTGLVGVVGLVFIAAGFAVLVDRGRSLAVSVGGLGIAVAVVLLSIGAGSTAGVLGVGVIALTLLLSGASIGGPAGE